MQIGNLLYSLTVPGPPVAQGRARSYRGHNKAGQDVILNVDPLKSRNFKSRVRTNILFAKRPDILIDEPIILSAYFYRKKPKSVKRGYPVTKPDLSNYLKGIEDALGGMVYRDDSLIVGYKDIWKLYDSERPRVEIYLYSIRGER